MKMVLIICPETRIDEVRELLDELLEALEEFCSRCSGAEGVRALVLPVEKLI